MASLLIKESIYRQLNNQRRPLIASPICPAGNSQLPTCEEANQYLRREYRWGAPGWRA